MVFWCDVTITLLGFFSKTVHPYVRACVKQNLLCKAKYNLIVCLSAPHALLLKSDAALALRAGNVFLLFFFFFFLFPFSFFPLFFPGTSHFKGNVFHLFALFSCIYDCLGQNKCAEYVASTLISH